MMNTDTSSDNSMMSCAIRAAGATTPGAFGILTCARANRFDRAALERALHNTTVASIRAAIIALGVKAPTRRADVLDCLERCIAQLACDGYCS